MRVCYRCKTEVPDTIKVTRRDTCPSCKADLHCCRNCSLFAPTASKQCSEPVAEPVKDKERATYCDYFVFAQERNSRGAGDADLARKALDDLFTKPGGAAQ